MDLLRYGIFALVIIAAGCGLLRDPTLVEASDETPIVHAILHAGQDTVYVLLQETVRSRDTTTAAVRPLRGAEVWLRAGVDTIRLREASPGFRSCTVSDDALMDDRLSTVQEGCYAAVFPNRLAVDRIYVLTFRTPDGRNGEGTTRIPASPAVSAPHDGSRHIVSRLYSLSSGHAAIPVVIDWPAGAAAVGVEVVAESAFRNNRVVADARCVLLARALATTRTQSIDLVLGRPLTCVAGTGSGTHPIVVDSVRAKLLVMAYEACSPWEGRLCSPAKPRLD
jgi:hypothetical protein